MKACQRAFTMVEMMAVVAVMAILAMIAIPSYLDKIVKAQIEASLPLADIAKKPIATMWATLQVFPEDNETAGLPVADKIVANYVTAVTVKDGVINMTFGNRVSGQLAGKILSIRPAVIEDEPVVPVAWICGTAEGPAKMKIQGENKTNIPDMYLPLECRSLVKKS